jgi:hypothetical protein
MKKTTFLLCCLLLAASLSSEQSDVPVLSGLYLGQKPPGMAPEIFAPGIVSTEESPEFSGTFSPDGKEYYFFRFAEGAGMMVTQLVGDRWTMPQPASFNTKYIDSEPQITPDGKYLLFCSNRPYPGSGDQRIMSQVWVMERDGDAWGAPKHLGMGMMPSVSDKGRVFIGPAVFELAGDKLVEVGMLDYDPAVPENERLPKHHTCMAPDESFHIFDFNEVLYVSFRTKNGTWGRPIDLSQRLDLPGGEMLPTLSPDRKYLFFCNRGDIYWVSAKIVEDLRPTAGAPTPASTEGQETQGVYALGRNDAALRKELDILKPLVGKTWASEMTDPSGRQTLHMSRLYEAMHDGKILKIHQECTELNSQTDGYYYYDPDKKEIAFLTLTNNGNFAVGNVKEEGGKILEYGHITFPDEKLEFRNTYKLTADGEMADHFLSFENGEWRAGHSRTWRAI